MATIHIPRHMRDATDGEAVVQVPGGQLTKVIGALLDLHPALDSLLMLDGRVRPDISVAINSEMTENGLLVPVPDDAEVYLVPALGGG